MSCDFCKDCKYFDTKSESFSCGNKEVKKCTGGFYAGSFVDPDAPHCPDFAPIPTIFARITASPEVLAPYCIATKPSIDGNTLYYFSTVTSHIYLTESQAFSATVARLKEVAE